MLRRVARFQSLCQTRQKCRNIARDAHPFPAGVQRQRFRPNGAQPGAHFGPAQIIQIKAEILAVWELRVMLSGAGEIRVDVEAEADIANNDKGRPAFVWRQIPRIAFRLALGLQHGLRPAGAAANAGAAVCLAQGE